MEYMDDLNKALRELDVKTIERIINIIRKRRLFIIGNGGSAANAIHMANDLQKIGGQNATALTNISLITAWANDTEYENVYVEQLKKVAYYGDVLIILSSSGDSENLVNAYKYAINNKMFVVNIVGQEGCKLDITKPMVETLCLNANTYIAEDLQLIVGHIMALKLQAMQNPF